MLYKMERFVFSGENTMNLQPGDTSNKFQKWRVERIDLERDDRPSHRNSFELKIQRVTYKQRFLKYQAA